MNIMTRQIAIEHNRLPILLFFFLAINCISFELIWWTKVIKINVKKHFLKEKFYFYL